MVIFCTIYYVLSYAGMVPQIVKLLKTKSSHDYSIGWAILQFISVLSWTIYIFTSNQKCIVCVGSIIDLILVTIVDFLILKYYNRQRRIYKKQRRLNKKR